MSIRDSYGGVRGLFYLFVITGLVIVVRIVVENLLPLFYTSLGLYFSDFLFQTLSNYSLTIGMGIADTLIVRKLVSTYGYKNDYGVRWRRLLAEIALVLVLSLATAFLYRNDQMHSMPDGTRFFSNVFLFIFMVYVLFNAIVVAVVDVVSYIRYKDKVAFEDEVRERVNASFRYQLLKSETNPHFLFNCLNVLDYLIQTDTEKAGAYTRRLAKVYRYLLQTEQQPYVTLEEELSFVEDYRSLLNERFGEALLISVDIPAELKDARVVPASLQILIENAVKHNVVSKARPLRISVTADTADKSLCVENNLQERGINVPLEQMTMGAESASRPNGGASSDNGTGIGLKNLRQQCIIVFDRPITIARTSETYIVRVPYR